MRGERNISLAAAGSSYLPCGRTIGFAVRLPRELLFPVVHVVVSLSLFSFSSAYSPKIRCKDTTKIAKVVSEIKEEKTVLFEIVFNIVEVDGRTLTIDTASLVVCDIILV